MTRWPRRLAWAPLALLLLTGCPSGGPPAGPAPRPAAAAWPEAAPPATLHATVDLSPALPGVPGSATAAVVTADGGMAVVVTPGDPTLPLRLVRVDPQLVPTGSTAIRGLQAVWGLQALPDDEVLLSGELASGPGFVVVDPRSGAQRDLPVTSLVADGGGSLLSADGRTAYLLVGESGGGSELVAVDVGSGTTVAERDLTDDVAAVSARGLAPYAAWLVPRPPDGIGVVFDAWPGDTAPAVPALLDLTADLGAVTTVGPLTALTGGASAGAVAAGPEGTLFLTVSRPDGAWVLALPPDGNAATSVVRLAASAYGYAVAVDPWQGWAMTPVPGGVQAVNLVTGGTRRVDVGCALDGTVRALAPGRSPTLVLAAGRCDAPATGTPMVWLVQL